MTQKSILIVEDEAIIALHIQNMLISLDYRVTGPVATGEAAIAAETPDLILMDIQLAGEMDGITAAQKIRTEVDVPIIFLTTYSQDSIIQKAKAIDPYCYLIKPVSQRELAISIEMALNRYAFDCQIKDQEAALREAHDELERRVEERTAALLLANEALRQEIAERQQVEASLQESKKRYRRIIEGVTDYVYTVHFREGTIETIHNPACEVVTGYTPEEYAADPNLWIRMVLPEDRTNVADYVKKSAAGQSVRPIEHRILHKGGQTRWVHSVLIPEFDAKGTLVAYEGVIKDITERKHAEKLVQESEEKYRSFFETVRDGAFIKRKDGRFVDCSQGVVNLFGYTSKSELMKVEVPSMYANPADGARVIQEIIEKGFVENLPLKIRTKKGDIRSILITSAAMKDEEGEVFLHGSVTDISERKLAEEKLFSSKATLSTIFDGISDPFIMLDKELRIKRLNKAAKKYYALTSFQEALGKFCFEGFRGRSSPCEGCEKCLSELHGFSGSYERRGGMYPDRIEQVFVDVVRDRSGTPEATIVRIYDITEVKIRSQQLIQSEKLASLGLLIAGIAHEINNPNNFIYFNTPILRTYLQFLLGIVDKYIAAHPDLQAFGRPYPDFREDCFKLLANIEHGTNRINQIVGNLREFVRDRGTGEMRQIDLKQVVEKTLSICQGRLKKAVKTFTTHIPEILPPLFTDPLALEQVLVNLLINAAQAADKDDSWIQLNITGPQEPEGEVVIEVNDNGCGMDSETLDKIFVPFFTTKAVGIGTGLGLSISHRLIAELGGGIEVESEVGKGSSFSLRLPTNNIATHREKG